jgi:hypothetical protein
VDNGETPLITVTPLNTTLPYRSDPDDIRRYLAALAQGGGETRLASLGLSRKNAEGVSAAVVALGLAAGRDGPLTDKGRRVAVTADADVSATVWRDVVSDYAPYAAIVGAVESATAPLPLTLEWIETYWAANGMGSSESNRAEGAATFARIAEAAAYGRFRQGRRGHVSRVEWNGTSARNEERTVHHVLPRRASPAARASGSRRTAAPEPTDEVAEPASSRGEGGTGAPAPVVAGPAAYGSAVRDSVPEAEPCNRIEWELSPGRKLRISVPPRLTPEEAQRVNALLRLLIPD